MAGSSKEDAVEERKSGTEAAEKTLTETKHTIEIVKEQYAQYYQMLRQHNALSWQIPSFVVSRYLPSSLLDCFFCWVGNQKTSNSGRNILSGQQLGSW